MADDSKEQLDIARQINQLIADRAGLLQQSSDSLNNQARVLRDMVDSLEKISKMRKFGENDEVAQNIEAAADAADKLGDSMEDAIKKGGGKDSVAGLNTKKIDEVTGSMTSGFSSVLGVLTSVARAGFSIVKSIFAIPFKIITSLAQAAEELRLAMRGLLQSIEDVKTELGSLESNEGKRVMEGFADIRKEAGNLGKSGLSVHRIFGRGPDGLATALGDLSDSALALGANLNKFGDELTASAAQFVIYRKGLGLTSEGFAGLAQRARATGDTLEMVLQETASLTLKMGAQFGISSKLISKDISEAAADVSNFGSVSKKELIATAVFARKLGIEFKELNGLIDKFDNFEDAAVAASHLSQAFGMNIDAMKMMNAQGTGQRLDELRRAFFAAGRSIDSMTRQERKLLEQQTGLQGAALENAFALENQALSYDEIADAADDAQNAQLTQAQAMRELASGIRQLIDLGEGYNGVLDALFMGFADNITQSAAYRNALGEVSNTLDAVAKIGSTVADAFMKLAGNDFFDALSNMLNPENITQLNKQFAEIFNMEGPGKGFKIYEALKGYLNKTAGPFMNLIKEYFMVAFKIISSVVKDIWTMPETQRAIQDGIAALQPVVGPALGSVFRAAFLYAIGWTALAGIFKATGRGIAKWFTNLGGSIAQKATKLKDMLLGIFKGGGMAVAKRFVLFSVIIEGIRGVIMVLKDLGAAFVMGELSIGKVLNILTGRILEFGARVADSLLFPFVFVGKKLGLISQEFTGFGDQLMNSWGELDWGFLGEAIWGGITAAFSGVGSWIMGVGGAIKDGFMDFFGIRSPSRVFMELGGNLMDGLAEGFKAFMGGPLAMFEFMKEKILGIVTKIKDGVLGVLSKVPMIGSMFGSGEEGGNSIATLAALQGELGGAITKQAQVVDLLSSSITVDLDAQIREFGDNVKVLNKTLQMENKPLKVNVNLNLTMNASDIAYVLQSDEAGENRLQPAEYLR